MDNYVVLFNEQTVVQIVLHLLTTIVGLGTIIMSLIAIVLFIKLSLRGIKALDLYLNKG